MEKKEAVVQMVLDAVERGDGNSIETKLGSVTEPELVGALKSLERRKYIEFVTEETGWFELTEEGEEIAQNGSWEYRVFVAVREKGQSTKRLEKTLGEKAKIGVGQAVKNGWVKVVDGTVTANTLDIKDEARESLLMKEKICEKTHAQLRKRKLLVERKRKTFNVKKGELFSQEVTQGEKEITKEMLVSREWEKLSFKEYNYDALGKRERKGGLAPLMKMRDEFREIFLQMGFTEMRTDKYIETSFWNFDTLFQPQSHPSRDLQDTFFVDSSCAESRIPARLLATTRRAHEEGIEGSEGHRYTWKLSETQKCILRTHTTAVTSRTLHEHSKQSPFRPGRYFSIDRVFRNETLDATHLAEFFQVEGVIVDRNIGVAELISVLSSFFGRLGMEDLRFKPAFNPYTEPSMEVFAYYPALKKHVEIGNSGLFRPEMLQAYGFESDVCAIAWGLSLERPAMIKFGVDDIRKLVGSAEISFNEDSSVCLL
ncbi:MAG: phenylalanyl-tRNA synthetase alpha subunit [Amphiamblys sp. WSBS2006]|nr:MAG: phenylalanyl-tRNA synthetase alpha subunit [Amphiamblys sp. WSBS2006]